MIPRGLLERLLLFAGRRHVAVGVVVFALVVVALLLTARLRLDADVLNLLPKHNPQVQAYRDTLEQFGSIDYFVVGVRIPEGAPFDPYAAYSDELVARMEQSGLFVTIEHRLGEPEDLLRQVFPNALLFLPPEGRAAVAARLTDEAIVERVSEIKRLLQTPQAIAMRELLRLDPLGLSPVFLERVGGMRGPLALDWTSGRYLSRDHRLLLILAKPARPPQDLAFDAKLVAEMERESAAAAESWNELAAGVELPRPEAFFGGRYLIGLDDERAIRDDVVLNLTSSLGGLLLLFYLAYRRRSLLVLATLPLVCGVVFTFGFASVAVGTLSATTAGVAALLFGLGDDFVIVLYGRYVQTRRAGLDFDASMRDLGGATARGVILGAATTAACFFAFLITDFTGLWQMGLMIGAGILFCLAAVLFLVPAMLAWTEAHHRKRDREPRLQVFGFGAEYLVRAARRRPVWVLAATAVLTLAAAAMAPRLQFEDNVEKLRPPGNRGVVAQQEINTHFGSGFDHMSLVVSAPTLDETLTLAERAAAGARLAVQRGELGGLDAVTSVLPPPTAQAQALAWLAEARSSELDPQRVRHTFATALAAEGLRAEPFAEGLDLFERAVAPPGPITRDTVLAIPQGRTLLDRYLKRFDGGWRSVVKLYPVPGRPKREVPQAAVDLATSLGPGATLTGINVVSRSLRGEVWRDASISAAIGMLLVLGLLAADFRRLSDALLALLPLGLGLVWMVGAMVTLGFSLNLMNVFVVTMIIGVGVDYGIHVVHRYREDVEAGHDGGAGLEETARAVLLAALTTVVGFGSIATSHYPGLVSMGVVATLGTLATALASIGVLPAYLQLRAERQERRGAGD